jgi:DNA-directed RNA polymerase subunit RPC12/RpoP
MTSFTSSEVNCSHCGNSFRIFWAASINTWLNPELIQKFPDDKYFYTCSNCNKPIHLGTKILINCPKGMFWINTNEDLETKKRILKEFNIIEKDGKILHPIMGVDLPEEDHLGLDSDFGN